MKPGFPEKSHFQCKLKNYSFGFAPTESNAGGTLLYISNLLSYKPCTGLGLNKADQLECTFIEIINSRKSNIIVGCLYKHPKMFLSLTKIILTPFLINCPKKTSKFFFLVILILTY